MASLSAAVQPQNVRAKQLLFESKREREFYRYYQPIRELTKNGPPLCDVGDEDAVRAHRPFSSPDRALTAFCQLGALRLKTRRAMLFFFDSNYAYVLAEATRTLSLQNDSVLSHEDGLWLGHTMIPRGYSVCEATVALPMNQGTNKDDANSGIIHIVNDLTGDARFCDRSFVTGGPKLKFYAGVPITTPKGINIGAYCVLDEQPRDGLDQDSVDFLRDMSATVMTHLEMVRATAEHKIGTQMIAGLGAFIDGASGFRDWAAKNGDFGLDEDPTISHPMGTQPMTTAASAVAQAAVQVGEQLEEEEWRASNSISAPNKQRSRVSTITGSPPSSLQVPTKAQTLKAKRSAENFNPDPAIANEQKTFSRAANLAREALSIDGVIFVDAAVGTFGGLVDTHEYLNASTEQCHESPGSPAEATTGTEGEERITRNSQDGDQAPRRCHILAASCMQQTPTDSEQKYNDTKQPEEMTEKLLRTLLRRYPRGKIWSFNEYGDASSEDEFSEYNTDAQACECSSGPPQNEVKAHSPWCSKRRKKYRLNDGKEILRLFPGVRSVGLVGMWDHTRQRWYAASIFWSYSPLRLFSEESDIKYMQAFCDVILAELHRLEAQNSDRAKSDFISTISHELRSPLHGILGSVECLQEQETDSFSAGLVSQVEVCGRTLLDIIDHLLDFSKINHHSRPKAGLASDAQGRKSSSNGAKRTRMGGLMVLNADVALDHVTEEIVETAVYSFDCSHDIEMALNRKVTVILDIDRSPDVDWRCQVAVGAWKRICINLVSNALKYTSKGHIRVSLKANPILDKKKRFNVTFSVSDTGRGMSRDFLENHLFRAFAQEDGLVEGTGLGMNLVAKIVKSFDGRIEVQSEKGVGSNFSITLPLERSRQSSSLMKTSLRPVERSIGGLRVGVIDNTSTPLVSLENAPDETARMLLLANIHHTLSQIGCEPMQCTWAGDDRVYVYLVTERELRTELQRRRDLGFGDAVMSPSALSNKPFIILCDSTLPARQIRAPGLGNIATGYIELVAQPAGPDRLVKGVASCLKNRSLVNSVQAMDHAVTDLESMVQQPAEQSIDTLYLPFRSRKDTALSSTCQEKKSGSSSSGTSDEAEPEEPERQRPARMNRSLASDYKFPQVPTLSMNGTHSRPSTGTTGKATESLKKSANRKTGPGISLLLVDDNPINLQLLVTYAEKFGHRKMIATDGQQAVDVYIKAASTESLTNSAETEQKPEIVRNDSSNDSINPLTGSKNAPPTKPEVILMDINMPVLNGFEATRQIRSFEKARGLQAAFIIALTGLGSASAQQEAFSSGVDLFLTKPVRLKELTKILDEIHQKPGVEGKV